MQDDNAAESSTATSSEVTSSPLEGMTGEQRTEWLKTGNLPAKEESAPSDQDTSSGAVSDDETDKPAPGSDPVKKQEPKKGKVDARIQELLDERHELRSRLERLEKSGDKKADPPPADKPEKKEAKIERPRRPKLAEFQGTYDEYESAVEQYEEKLADFKVSQALAADREDREKQSQDKAVEAENAKILQSWKERTDAAKKEIPDFADVAFNKELKVNPTTDGYILKDPLGAKILHALGSDLDEAARIAALDPFDTMEALVEIKRSLSGTEKKAPEKKPQTKAPPPPTELTGRNTEAADEAEAALASGDFARYQRVMNRRETKKE